ncbi:MAG TPA: SPFH domain-containing protein [Pyrinomonadaceae bacterium]|jgi:membrane protease subunit (stomatin/prohibitin family)|nr:SPFH domain-containing protein [Pyrinomonadaceae bacterium]
MGILDRLSPSSQFIEVIEWLDETSNTLVYRFPVKDQEIKNGAQLIVRESQSAIFVSEGQIADLFPPGRYTIDGGNTPILSKLGAWKYGFNSPFKAEVYFVNTKQFTDLKWGTPNPVMMRDTDFGMVRLRAFGIYTVRVSDPKAFIKEIAGTNARFVTDDIQGQLKRTLVGGFSDALAESKIAALDLASNYDELSKFTRDKLNDEFKTLGLELTKFVIENISLPQEVEAAMDKRTSMGVIGDVGRYTQFQAADAMRDAAQNPGGGAGTGVGLGAGFAMGNAMAGAMSDAMKQPRQGDGEQIACPKCNAANTRGTKFCHECGAKLEVEAQTVPCVKCSAPLPAGAKFCNECGAKQEKLTCANCKAELGPGVKFCNECGQKVE